jgi:hypothetical protein
VRFLPRAQLLSPAERYRTGREKKRRAKEGKGIPSVERRGEQVALRYGKVVQARARLLSRRPDASAQKVFSAGGRNPLVGSHLLEESLLQQAQPASQPGRAAWPWPWCVTRARTRVCRKLKLDIYISTFPRAVYTFTWGNYIRIHPYLHPLF